MQSSANRRFVDAYLNEVGDLRNSVDRLQLYEIAIAAGKDLLISDLGATEKYQFVEAYAIFERLSAPNFMTITELCCSSKNESKDTQQQYQQFIPLKKLIETLHKENELNEDEKKRVLEFLESFASCERLDYRKLFDEFEKTRARLLDVTAHESTQKQAEIKNRETPDDLQQNSLPSSPTSRHRIHRRAFRLTNSNDRRVLHYHFVLNQSQIIWIECESLESNDQPADRRYTNDLFLVLYDIIEEKAVTVTQKLAENRYISEQCLLGTGEYVLSVCTLNCAQYTDTAPTNDKTELIDINGKLTKHFKMTLMNLFDLFDLDESGTLSREEFDIYNLLASDEHVSDQEWDILCKNFQTKNNELPLSSFIALHQVEADNDQSMEDTWLSLLCIGYNERLDLIWNCPCSFTIHSESDVYMRQVELRESTVPEEEALATYFWKNGREIDSDADVRIWKCDYFAVCVAGPMKLPFAMNIDYANSENVQVKEQIQLQRIQLKFKKPKILLQAVATEPEWSLVVTVETTT